MKLGNHRKFPGKVELDKPIKKPKQFSFEADLNKCPAHDGWWEAMANKVDINIHDSEFGSEILKAIGKRPGKVEITIRRIK